MIQRTIDEKKARFFAIAKELGYRPHDIAGAMVRRYEQTSYGRHHTCFTASVVTGVPETRIQEVDYAVENRIERLHGAAAVHGHV
ncbi:hypothetical protein [Paracidovorax oryzae]|uniref:hypothetical protein n=1 Tax=Paracidovorax oryzae TaxID=862720 RepID=UPI0003022A25|nr:hypothetical protein [Paracidovorax oryzae]